MTVALIDAAATKVIEYREDSALNTDQGELAPGKPYLVPVVIENETYNPDTQIREEPPATIVEPTRVVWRYTVRNKTTQEVEQMRSDLLVDLREEEFKRMHNVLTDGEQFAMTIGGFEGILNHGTDRANWPAGLRNQFDALFNVANTTCKSIHQTYNTKKNEINALTTAQQIADYDITTGWPA